MSTNELDKAQVGEWITQVQNGIADIEQRLSPLLEERARLEARERILRSLLESVDGSDADPEVASPSETLRSSNGESVKQYVETRVIEILEETDRNQLHINEIFRRFRDRGYDVPGAGQPVNITSHIRISDRITSPQRGYYGLKERIGQLPVRTARRAKTKRNSS